MGAEINKNGLITISGDVWTRLPEQIRQLNNDEFFKHPFTNLIGRHLVYYMANPSHFDLFNPSPADLKKNSMSKSLIRLKNIDHFINKPLNEYTNKDINKLITGANEDSFYSANGKLIDKNQIKDYITEFKRIWKIYRQYMIHKNKKQFNPIKFEWGLNIRAPTTTMKYEDYPELKLSQIIGLSEKLWKEEYKVRMLLAVNLMGRDCEMTALKLENFKIDGNNVSVKLPRVKKHSSEKTLVELYSYSKKPLLTYLSNNKFGEKDLIFPSKASAFAKNLRETSNEHLKIKINPKTLRKLGLCVAEELGYSQEDSIRIGGWAVNSPVVAHYFKRNKAVSVKKDKEKAIENEVYKDVYLENDKLKSDVKSLKDQMERVIGLFAQGDPDWLEQKLELRQAQLDNESKGQLANDLAKLKAKYGIKE